ncbi:hypothetical protein HK097_002932, partial [Rhizophlyctis rosea]
MAASRSREPSLITDADRQLHKRKYDEYRETSDAPEPEKEYPDQNEPIKKRSRLTTFFWEYMKRLVSSTPEDPGPKRVRKGLVALCSEPARPGQPARLADVAFAVHLVFSALACTDDPDLRAIRGYSANIVTNTADYALVLPLRFDAIFDNRKRGPLQDAEWRQEVEKLLRFVSLCSAVFSVPYTCISKYNRIAKDIGCDEARMSCAQVITHSCALGDINKGYPKLREVRQEKLRNPNISTDRRTVSTLAPESDQLVSKASMTLASSLPFSNFEFALIGTLDMVDGVHFLRTLLPFASSGMGGVSSQEEQLQQTARLLEAVRERLIQKINEGDPCPNLEDRRVYFDLKSTGGGGARFVIEFDQKYRRFAAAFVDLVSQPSSFDGSELQELTSAYLTIQHPDFGKVDAAGASFGQGIDYQEEGVGQGCVYAFVRRGGAWQAEKRAYSKPGLFLGKILISRTPLNRDTKWDNRLVLVGHVIDPSASTFSSSTVFLNGLGVVQ